MTGMETHSHTAPSNDRDATRRFVIATASTREAIGAEWIAAKHPVEVRE